jgi:hypothetical protein
MLCIVMASGCAGQSDSRAAMREHTAKYSIADSSLTVRGYGDWNGTNATLVFEYSRGEAHRQVTVDVAKWSASGDPAVATFFTSVDQSLMVVALATLRASSPEPAEQSAFRHFQTRILSAQMPQALGAGSSQLEEGGECYCYQCQIHHPPECIKKDAEETFGPAHVHADSSAQLEEGGECYCYQCQIHHPPECIKNDAETL